MRALSCVAALALVCSCSDGGNNSNPDSSVPTPDTTGPAKEKAKLPLDLPPLADLAQKLPCESEWRDAIHAQTKVSTGAVSSTETAGVNTTTIDATAGGINLAFQNPFVYVSLEKGGTRVDIDDMAARTSTEWDLAFRRAVIRINGGDSGAGQGAVNIQSGKTFDQVTSVPASSFAQDDFLDDSCVLKKNPIDDIWCAIGDGDGMWYVYDMSGMKLTPKAETYVIRSAKGKFFKLVVDTYYKGTTGANYTIRWSALQ
jgi:hypothetical protein